MLGGAAGDDRTGITGCEGALLSTNSAVIEGMPLLIFLSSEFRVRAGTYLTCPPPQSEDGSFDLC